jgi:predicted nucleic acid-binding protein
VIVKLYLDNSVLNRLFDDQNQPRVRMETVALISVLQLAEQNKLSTIASAIHHVENDRNPFPLRHQWVRRCLQSASSKIVMSDAIEKRAAELESDGVKPLDALHLASAESAGAEYFLSSDDRLLRRYAGSLRCLNPAAFLLHYFREA